MAWAQHRPAFLALHHLWIEPIWFILVPGLVVAVLGGLAIGWAYAEIRVGLPTRPWIHLGGVAGRRLGQSMRAAFAMALAGFVFALGPGHNIPLLGGTPGTAKGAMLLAAIAAISTVVLVESQAWLSRRGRPDTTGHE